MNTNARMLRPVTAGGFGAVIEKARGEAASLVEINEAIDAIKAALPRALTYDIYLYLGSEYGDRTAQEVLAGRPVALQLEMRMTRFLKHFEEVRRRV